MFYHLISTYQSGPRLKSGHLTRAGVIRICKRLTEKWGYTVFHEGKCDGFIQVKVPVGYKSCRLHGHTRERIWLTGEELETWKDDDTVVFPDLAKAGTFLKGFDGARWEVWEILDLVEALADEGVDVLRSTIPRKFNPYLPRRELWDLWAEKTTGLRSGDRITEDSALGLLSFGGVDVTVPVLFGQEGVPISKCIDGYYEPTTPPNPVMIKVGDEQIHVRKVLLTSNSEVFEAMLGSPMQEGLTSTINLTELGISMDGLKRIFSDLEDDRSRIPKLYLEDAIRLGETYMMFGFLRRISRQLKGRRRFHQCPIWTENVLSLIRDLEATMKEQDRIVSKNDLLFSKEGRKYLKYAGRWPNVVFWALLFTRDYYYRSSGHQLPESRDYGRVEATGTVDVHEVLSFGEQVVGVIDRFLATVDNAPTGIGGWRDRWKRIVS